MHGVKQIFIFNPKLHAFLIFSRFLKGQNLKCVDEQSTLRCEMVELLG
jgi:hypothetical protein